MNKIGLILTAFLLQSCMVFVPKVSSNDLASCPTVTKQLDLKAKDISRGDECFEDNCLAKFLVGVAGSFIVSGSVVVVNNAIHWAEYSDKCKALEQIGTQGGKSCVQECDLKENKCTCIH